MSLRELIQEKWAKQNWAQFVSRDKKELIKRIKEAQAKWREKCNSIKQCKLHLLPTKKIYVDGKKVEVHQAVPKQLRPFLLSDEEIIRLEQFDGLILTPSECNVDLPLSFNYAHLDPIIEINCETCDVIGLTGFHHDGPDRAIQNSGLIDVVFVREDSHGCYEIKWRYGNGEWKPSTLFPDNWSRDNIFEKVIESIEKNIDVTEEKPGSFIVQGYTSEGILIESRIKIKGNLAKVTTAYPVVPIN